MKIIKKIYNKHEKKLLKGRLTMEPKIHFIEEGCNITIPKINNGKNLTIKLNNTYHIEFLNHIIKTFENSEEITQKLIKGEIV